MNEALMNIVIVGHVDHGKSTIIGRLLADTNSLSEGKLEQVKLRCERNSKPFEYAFLLDALKDEQAQGITIDIARCFFKTQKRKYLILDAPGHIEFLKNMITGAAHAEAALLVIDAKEGVQENSRRHGYMLNMLGIKQLTVLVNKMDLINYDRIVYDRIVTEYKEFLAKLDVQPTCFIPVSGREGDNIASLSERMPWYNDQTVLQVLDAFEKAKPDDLQAFRMPVQDVYKFTQAGDDRRIIAGRVETGKLNIGDRVVFYPSQKSSRVKSIEGFNELSKKTVSAGFSAGFTLEEQIYIKRGEMAVCKNEKLPCVATRILASLFWLGKKPLVRDKDYFIKLGTTKVRMRIERIERVLDASTLANEDKQKVDRHEVAECILQLAAPIAFDLAKDNAITSRFVIIDDYDIAGGGLILEALHDEDDVLREMVQRRNIHWITSDISREERIEKYQQKNALIIVTGVSDSARRNLAKDLEKKLFEQGKIVYYLGMGNIIHGVNADIENTPIETRSEHLRRFSEVINILLDSGQLIVSSIRELTQEELDFISATTECDDVFVFWMGDKITTNVQINMAFKQYKTSQVLLDEIMGGIGRKIL